MEKLLREAKVVSAQRRSLGAITPTFDLPAVLPASDWRWIMALDNKQEKPYFFIIEKIEGVVPPMVP